MSDAPSGQGLFEHIRSRCAEVTRRARHVRIDPEALEALAARLCQERPVPPQIDPARERVGDASCTLAFVITLDALNFGSGYFPVLRKRPGLSGYLSISSALREHFAAEGPWSAEALTRLDADACARLFGQPRGSEGDELMELFARALRDLGSFLTDGYEGRFMGPIEAAGGRAEALVERLTEMPLYRDVARYEDLEVPFYKRAQITCADLAAAFQGQGPGRFEDLDELTLFADNLVPHVLRMSGVLVYARDLTRWIDEEKLLPAGSPEEVEIRAVAVHAVEGLAATCRRGGWEVVARQLDLLLWTQGQSPDIKAVPRHRTRCSYY